MLRQSTYTLTIIARDHDGDVSSFLVIGLEKPPKEFGQIIPENINSYAVARKDGWRLTAEHTETKFETCLRDVGLSLSGVLGSVAADHRAYGIMWNPRRGSF